jgi:hypothetical protein
MMQPSVLALAVNEARVSPLDGSVRTYDREVN